MKPLLAHTSELLGVNVQFANDTVGEDAKSKSAALKPGEVLMIENLRFHAEEEGKGVDKAQQDAFTKALASIADVYINDAFGTAHRAHASTALVADYFDTDNKMFGYVINSELESLDKVLKSPNRPMTAIMGGAKVSTKITIIENLLDKVDNLILGGGMTYTFVKAHGGHVGGSICEDDYIDMALQIEKAAKEKGVKIYIASDVVAADDFSNDANTKIIQANAIPDGWEGLDAGPESIKMFKEVIENSGTILWNGPVGVFEMEAFEKGSKAVADAIVAATEKGAFSLIGGGDSVACINKFGLSDKVSYISTAGGALLEYLEGRELPGIKTIRG
jgi:phosphoglycerate kinase